MGVETLGITFGVILDRVSFSLAFVITHEHPIANRIGIVLLSATALSNEEQGDKGEHGDKSA
jgi:hypothetical protein